MKLPLYLLLIISLNKIVLSFEILSTSIAIISMVAKPIGKYTYCKLKECCTEDEIPANFTKLDKLLQQNVYGQHLVQDVLIHALRAHWSDTPNQKALVLSFHGWPGGGKNYVTSFIIESLFREGSKSKHVHHFIGRTHFPRHEMVEDYRENLYNWIKGNVSNCARQMFIFDEVDKMPPNLLNVIKPLIDHNKIIDGVDYRDSVFIFLSNIGSKLITDRFMQLWRSGLKREQIELNHFENLIAVGAFNEDGGFHHLDAIKNSLIDHYIPFLPMEEQHVRLCILDAFKMRGIPNPKEEHVRSVLKHIEWGPSPENLFSKTGCKRLSQKVAMLVEKFYHTLP